MSEDTRSWTLTEKPNIISLSFQDQNLLFLSLKSLETAIEDLFMSQISQNIYENVTNMFSSTIEDNEIVVCMHNKKFVFPDQYAVDELENALCSLYASLNN